MTQIRTRFAPSPTGYLHTGSARTALFNYLFSKKTGGKYTLRIEDTDKERSTKDATQKILSDLKWLGLSWDEEEVYQSERIERHKQIAFQLLDEGKAYRCNYVIRLRANLDGKTTITDQVMGEISVDNKEMDDLIMLRSDGTPTYMLAVVVDDHDMGITNIIRGDDHLTNSFRQHQIYSAMGWAIPEFAHIPLIHDTEGKKLSKRKGALGIFEYREKGYLPEAVCNHLLRLGWSHGDDEIIPMDKAIEWFSLDGIGKSPSRFDLEKLNHINKHYMQQKTAEEL
ncbi:UNVERIFIED_CONTAM: hypothetical protein GTU68_063378, partial [Idotea baltica]|nr:hypothetical protein [Idotea baltica]